MEKVKGADKDWTGAGEGRWWLMLEAPEKGCSGDWLLYVVTNDLVACKSTAPSKATTRGVHLFAILFLGVAGEGIWRLE